MLPPLGSVAVAESSVVGPAVVELALAVADDSVPLPSVSPTLALPPMLAAESMPELLPSDADEHAATAIHDTSATRRMGEA
ncbi:MAG: hypothetical protein IPN32_39260 [Deltaproteobacteria bacterium]|nr:hypothetical protein [Deltaproteobacteria bacterium]